MRYAVLSDVHGNAYALRAAIARLAAAGVDGWLCAGDIVGYGPHPNECIELLAELDAQCVAGNHELLVLGELSLERSGRLAKETTEWTRSVLRDDCRAYLASLPLSLRLSGIFMVHASLADPETYVVEPTQAARELSELKRVDPEARALVLGHTHQPWLFDEAAGTVPAGVGAASPLAARSRFLLNPGSVGQSRQREPLPRSRFALLDLEQRDVRFFTEPYDVVAAADALRRNGLPRSCIHLPPGQLRAIPRRGRALARRARRYLHL